MRSPLRNLIRLTAITALGLSVVAVGLGKRNRASVIDGGPAPVRYAGFGIYRVDGAGHHVGLLDLETGRVEQLPLPRARRFDEVSCAPWRDEDGGMRIVGRWLELDANNGADACGLALLSFPSGRILHRVPTEVLPKSALCWYPGTSPRILFTAGDGVLYRYRFDDTDGQETNAPHPVRWRRLPEGVRSVYMQGPTYSMDPALKGRVLIGLGTRRVGVRSHVDNSKLWWLELDRDGREILAAGRLTRSASPLVTDQDGEEQLPVVGRLASGALHVAFLARATDGASWRLMIAPIDMAPSGEPVVQRARARVLAEGCAAIAPSFSLDGRWIAYLPKREINTPNIQRVYLSGAEVAQAAR